MKIPRPENLTRDAAKRLEQLAESLGGWNLLAAVYADDSASNDEAAAFAERGRRIVLNSIRLTLQLALAGLDGNRKHFNRLLRQLDETDRRERDMASLMKAVLLRSDRKGASA